MTDEQQQAIGQARQRVHALKAKAAGLEELLRDQSLSDRQRRSVIAKVDAFNQSLELERAEIALADLQIPPIEAQIVELEAKQPALQERAEAAKRAYEEARRERTAALNAASGHEITALRHELASVRLTRSKAHRVIEAEEGFAELVA